MEHTIALNQLTASSENVRTLQPCKDEDQQLIASISNHGILQNLVIAPCSSDDSLFEVIAGGRRLAALRHLASINVIPEDYPVRCLRAEASNATEYSIAENLKADMHPSDLFVAYKKLVDQGRSIKDIAVRFGRTQKDVKQLLRLADVSPIITDAYRKGDLDLEQVMAYTVCDDLEKQEAVFKTLGSYPSSYIIKSNLVNTQVTETSGITKFVTLKAYRKAGGTISTDLFGDLNYINDPELMREMAAEKMATLEEMVQADGWSWVESYLFDNGEDEGQRVSGVLSNIPTELSDKLTAIEAELQTITAQLDDDQCDLDVNTLWDRHDELIDKRDSANRELDSYRVYSDEDKARSGVKIVLNNGVPEYIYGILRNNDDEEAATTLASTPNDAASTAPPATVQESQALTTDLHNYELQALQSRLMRNTQLCKDISTYTMAMSILGRRYHVATLGLSVTPTPMSATSDIDDTLCAGDIKRCQGMLNLAWLEAESDQQRFVAFQTLSRIEKDAIFNYCVARTLLSSRNDVAREMASQMNFNLADHWQPTKDNYFNRLKREGLDHVAAQLKDDEFVKQHAESKKADFAAVVADLDEVRGWLPDTLAQK